MIIKTYKMYVLMIKTYKMYVLMIKTYTLSAHNGMPP